MGKGRSPAKLGPRLAKLSPKIRNLAYTRMGHLADTPLSMWALCCGDTQEGRGAFSPFPPLLFIPGPSPIGGPGLPLRIPRPGTPDLSLVALELLARKADAEAAGYRASERGSVDQVKC
jgi:hypothetical protein